MAKTWSWSVLEEKDCRWEPLRLVITVNSLKLLTVGTNLAPFYGLLLYQDALNKAAFSKSIHQLWSNSRWKQLDPNRQAVGDQSCRIRIQGMSVFVTRLELWTPVSIWIQKAVDRLKPAGWKRRVRKIWTPLTWTDVFQTTSLGNVSSRKGIPIPSMLPCWVFIQWEASNNADHISSVLIASIAKSHLTQSRQRHFNFS